MDYYFKRKDITEINLNLKGLDLNIDPNVHKICEVSNSSSGSSRAVLYVLLVISITSLIALINTNRITGWTRERIENAKNELFNASKNANNKNKSNLDSFSIIKDIAGKEYENITKATHEHVTTINVPVLGNSFDINNLAVFSGISYLIVLVVLWVTMRREKINLRIALHAISERYPDPKEYPDERLSIILDTINTNYFKISPSTTLNEFNINEDYVKLFNFTRRKHHYNFLSMNEVFILPEDLKITQNIELLDNSDLRYDIATHIPFKRTVVGRIVQDYLHHFPFWVYMAIFINDFISITFAMNISLSHTIIQLIATYFLLNTIAYLCQKCNNEKRLIQGFYDLFPESDYKFTERTNRINELDGNIFTFSYFMIKSYFRVLKQRYRRLKTQNDVPLLPEQNI